MPGRPARRGCRPRDPQRQQPGPLREIDGTRLATYTTGWFSGWGWESPSSLLLDVNGRRKFATVRCTLAACENATDPAPTISPRQVTSHH